MHFLGPTALEQPGFSIMTSTLAPPDIAHRSGRARSSSIVKVEEVGAVSQEDSLDQSAYVNMNVEWVNQKGALQATSTTYQT